MRPSDVRAGSRPAGLVALAALVLLGGCGGGAADRPTDDLVDSQTASCGNGICSGKETCSTCPADCGACTFCGDGACNGGETCADCVADCGTCPTSCGDGSCNGGETCDSCAADCGACPPVCGDGACNGTETCSTCAADCGACPPTASCGDGTCNGTETCSTCAADCGACPSTGKKIAFASSRDGNSEIYSANADGTGITRLTNDPARDDEPTWSPDGQHIAFTSDRTGTRELFVMNADGSNVVQRTFSATGSQAFFELYPAWSPDGDKIAYSTLSDGSTNIWVVSPTSGSPTLLLAKPGWDAQPAWSPDGARLALVSDWFAYDMVYDIYLTGADGSGFTALTGNIFDHIDYLRPSWSPSGTRIAVTIMQTVGIDQYITDLGVMNDDGSALMPLMSAATWAKSSWSPDGQTIAFTSGTPGALDVSWVKADGSGSGVLISNAWNPEWQR